MEVSWLGWWTFWVLWVPHSGWYTKAVANLYPGSHIRSGPTMKNFHMTGPCIWHCIQFSLYSHGRWFQSVMQLSSGKQIRLISRNNSYSFKPKLDYLKEKSNIITRLVSCLQVPLCVRFKHEEIRRVSHRWKSKETHRHSSVLGGERREFVEESV